MIWRATGADLPELVMMAGRFLDSVGEDWDGPSVAEYMTETLGDGVIFRSERGMIGGTLVPIMWAREKTMAVELFWWSEDSTGLRLLRVFERWAAESGASRVIMSTINQRSRIDAALARLGYAEVERAYRKEF